MTFNWVCQTPQSHFITSVKVNLSINFKGLLPLSPVQQTGKKSEGTWTGRGTQSQTGTEP